MTARGYLILAALAAALAVAAGSCSRRHQPAARQPSRRTQPTPEEFFRSVLPASWEIQVEEKTVPVFWVGPRSCKCITLTNPSEMYYGPDFSDAYHMLWQKYVPGYQFWFCPRDWKGAPPHQERHPPFPKYPAEYLCEGQTYKIYHLDWGQKPEWDMWQERRRDDLPAKVAEAFGKAKHPGAIRLRLVTP